MVGMTAKDAAQEIARLVDEAYHGVNVAIVRGLAETGHPEIRAAHSVVFELVGTGSHVSQLARDAGMTKQAMAELVRHLEQHGYVERRPDPDDRRAALVVLTKRGREARDRASAVLDEILGRWHEALGARRLADLRRSLTMLVDAIPTSPQARRRP